MAKTIDPSRVSYSIHVQCDDTPIAGNALASGCDETDKKYENELIDRLARGDVWGWALVRVTAHYPDTYITGVDYLGHCTYANEAEFRGIKGGYFDDMKEQALANLSTNLSEMDDE